MEDRICRPICGLFLGFEALHVGQQLPPLLFGH